jgi:diaminopimelate epimerase
MRLAFIKCHGSGNDFPLIDARGLAVDEGAWPGVARALADRRGPVGGDGLLLLTEGDMSHEFGMRMFNPDGSEAETCLNGLRCVARLGFERLGLESATARLRTSSVAVARDPALSPGVETIRETAGPANRHVAAWLRGIDGDELIDGAIAMLPGAHAFTAVAMPNPHLVTFVERIDEAELVAIGDICETAPSWLPTRANVSFVERRDTATLFVRTFERGVGLTDSCGSAMAASAHIACLLGHARFGETLTILNKGGLVRAQATRDGMVSLSGNATFEWEGSAEIDPGRGIAGAVTIAGHHNDEIAAWARVAEAATAIAS